MYDINKVILLGRLGADPSMRYTKSGTALAQMSLATKRRFMRSEGAKQVQQTSVSALPENSSSAFSEPSLTEENCEITHAVDPEEEPCREEKVETQAGQNIAKKNIDYSNWTEETQWHRIIVWGKQAQSCAQYLKKGSPIYVEGWIRCNTYNDKNGQRRFYSEVQCEVISFLAKAI
jgi:single-stranded DNA-binding protein